MKGVCIAYTAYAVIYRILWFYICGVIVIGMLVSPSDPSLTVSGSAKSTAAASPFVIAIRNVGIQVS
jgi:amino acid transporter